MRGLGNDLCHAWRIYRTTPFQSVTTVLVVAVSLAFSTAFFSLYHELALKPVGGLEAPSQLIRIGLSDGASFEPLPGRLREAMAERSTSTDVVAGISSSMAEVTVDEQAQQRKIALVTADYYSGLGVRVAHGRGLEPSDAQAEGPRVVVLDNAFWEQEYSADPGVLGESLLIYNSEFEIVGVAHEDFAGIPSGERPQLWATLPRYLSDRFVSDENHAARVQQVMETYSTNVLARVGEGQSASSARLEMHALTDALREEHRDQLSGQRLEVASELAGDPYRVRAAIRQIQLFVITAVLLAVIAAVNLSMYFLARAPGRQREMGIRLALGATPLRLARQLFTESSMLVLTGALLGWFASLWTAVALRGLPFFEGVEWDRSSGIDWPVLLFAAALAVVLSTAVALAPVLDLTRRSIIERARQTRVSAVLSQRLLTFAQVAVAAVVLSATLLFIHALAQATYTNPGYSADGVTVIEPEIAVGSFRPDPDATNAFRRAVSERLANVDAVSGVGFGSPVPAYRAAEATSVKPIDGLVEEIGARAGHVSAGWYDVLGITVLRGQLPAVGDSDAVVISRRFAQMAWGHLDVLDREIVAPAAFGAAFPGMTNESFHVAAVIDDVRFGHPADRPRPLFFTNKPGPVDTVNPIIIKGRLDRAEAEGLLDDLLADANPPLRLNGIVALDSEYREQLAGDRARTLLTGIAGALVVMMAALGFFGTLRFMVDTRRFEFALRAALGAGPDSLRRQVLRHGVLLGLPGLMIGLLLSAIGLSWIREVFELSTLVLWPALVSSGLILGSLLLIAAWRPAQRAANRNPGPVLREE